MHTKQFIDLRSDTTTKPSLEMREAIYKAEVGDNGYSEDKPTIELEQYCADYFGKEAALFMCSGTMSDQVAIRCQTMPGEEVIIDNSYHINYFQAGSTIDLGKVSLNVCHTPDGILTASVVKDAICNKFRNELLIKPSLVCLENTINSLGGIIFPFEELEQTYQFSKEKGLAVHLDGARLLNACVATKIDPKKYTALADTVSICLSKGLGAPFGSILVGSRDIIKKAVRHRRWVGGQLHQSGFMAAAALFAIQHNITRLAVDNNHAKLLATLLYEQKDNPLGINLSMVETNMVMINTRKLGVKSDVFAKACQNKGVLLYPWTEYNCRAVTHLDISESQVRVAAGKIIETSLQITRGE